MKHTRLKALCIEKCVPLDKVSTNPPIVVDFCYYKDVEKSTGFLFQLFMSTLANQDIFETLYEEALEEIGISKDSLDELGINENSLFYPNACKIAEQMAMEKFLSNTH